MSTLEAMAITTKAKAVHLPQGVYIFYTASFHFST
jgi:hypothetical protein